MARIRAVLFDFGGVFTDSPFHAAHAFGAERGLGPLEVTTIVFGSYEADGDHPPAPSLRDLGRERAHTIEIQVAGEHVGARLGEPAGDLRAETAGGAGHHGDAAVEPDQVREGSVGVVRSDPPAVVGHLSRPSQLASQLAPTSVGVSVGQSGSRLSTASSRRRSGTCCP